MKKILIVGGTGQFGFYLTKFLINKNFKIYISTRYLRSSKVIKLKKLFYNKNVNFLKINVINKKNIIKNLKIIKPEFIFYFAGQSSVADSFKKPKEALLSNFNGCQNFLDAILKLNLKVKFFNAASSEIFGHSKNKLSLNSPKNPVSPYGKAKLKSFNIVQKYRKKFNLNLYNGIIFNSEFFLRPIKFILPKICIAAINAHKFSLENKKINFPFGNINVKRDWGWCEEYVKIIWLNIIKKPHDFIVATGKSYSVKDLLDFAFNSFDLNWKDYVVVSSAFLRKKEINSIRVDKKYLEHLSISLPKIDGLEIVRKLIKHYNSSSD